MLDLDLRMQEVGKVKVGEKGEEKTSGQNKKYRLPKQLDHFLVVRVERLSNDSNSNYKHDNEAMEYISKPEFDKRIVPVRFLYDDYRRFWESYYGMFTGTGRAYCISKDGKKAKRYWKKDKEGKRIARDIEHAVKPDSIDWTEESSIECLGSECPYAMKKHCKPNGRLEFILPFIKQIGGVYTFRTTSWSSVRNIQSSLDFFSKLTGGRMTCAEFALKMQMKTTRYTDENGNLRLTSFPEVGIVFLGSSLNDLIKNAASNAIEFGKTHKELVDANKLIKTDIYNLTPDEADEFVPEQRIIEIEKQTGRTVEICEAPIQENESDSKIDATEE